MSKCVKCGKDPQKRFFKCSKCNPNDLLVACKCKGCQCNGSFAPDGDFMPEGYGYDVDGDIVPIDDKGRPVITEMWSDKPATKEYRDAQYEQCKKEGHYDPTPCQYCDKTVDRYLHIAHESICEQNPQRK